MAATTARAKVLPQSVSPVKARNNSFNRLASGSSPRTAPAGPRSSAGQISSSSPEPQVTLLPLAQWLEVTPVKATQLGVEGTYRRVALRAHEQVLYVMHPPAADPEAQRFLWCRAGEWRFASSLRHSAPPILRHDMENMVGVPDCGWKKPASEPEAVKQWAAAHISIAVATALEGMEENMVDLFTGDGHYAGPSHLSSLSITRRELWGKIKSELELGLLALQADVAAKYPDKVDAPPTHGDVLQQCLAAVQGARDGKGDVKVATLFAKHGKAYNLIKYATAVAEACAAVPVDDGAVTPDFGATPEKPGPLEAVVADMSRLVATCCGLSDSSTEALDMAAANLQAWKAHLLGLRNAALYACRGGQPYTQPLPLRRRGSELAVADPLALDEFAVFRRLLTVVSGAVRAYVVAQQGTTASGAGIEALHTHLDAAGELVSPPSPIQVQLFGFFHELLTLVLTSPLDNLTAYKWLSQHDVTDVAIAWQQYDWISVEQLVKVGLARAQQLLDTWEDWTGPQHNANVIRETWAKVITAREQTSAPRTASSARAGEERASPEIAGRRLSHGRPGSSPLAFRAGSPATVSTPAPLDSSPPNIGTKGAKKPAPLSKARDATSGTNGASGADAAQAAAQAAARDAALAAAIHAATTLLVETPTLAASLSPEGQAVVARFDKVLTDLLSATAAVLPQ